MVAQRNSQDRTILFCFFFFFGHSVGVTSEGHADHDIKSMTSYPQLMSEECQKQSKKKVFLSVFTCSRVDFQVLNDWISLGGDEQFIQFLLSFFFYNGVEMQQLFHTPSAHNAV